MKMTRSILINALRENSFVKKEAARKLGVDEATVRRWCEKFGMDVEVEKKLAITSITAEKFKVKHSSRDVSVNSDSWFALPDMHDKDADPKYLDSVTAFLHDFKPKYFICIGDLLDYTCLMEKVKTKYPSFDGKDIYSLEVGFQAAAHILSRINEALPKSTTKVFLKGNHEYRADILIGKNDEFNSILNMEKRLDFSGWKILPYLEPYKLGRLNFIHGEFYGGNHVQKHLKHYQKNVIYGHTHAIAQDTMASPMRKIPIWGASIGCGCNLNPDYQRNKSNQWQHGFAYGWFDPTTGDFDQNIKRVIDGRFWAEGRRYQS